MFLGGRIVGHEKQSAWLYLAQGMDCVFVSLKDEKAVIPVFIDPAFAQFLQIRKVEHSPDRVLITTRNEEICNVVVAVKILALSAMLKKSMPRTKLNASHNGQAHEFIRIFGRSLEALAVLNDKCR